MDDVDRAKIAEMRFREQALARIRNRTEEDEQVVLDGVVVCRDCGAPIDPRRLEARPESVRCIDCKTLKEAREARGG